tara:strand:+ start:763 stop:1836 length:1074 start_codon:yes stop_codon:yes gene_type:complete
MIEIIFLGLLPKDYFLKKFTMLKKYLYFILIILCFSCTNQSGDYRNNLITKAISQVSPSVVGIIVKSKDNTPDEFGSGLAINNDGYIITNAHVVEFSNNIIVTTMGGEKFSAEIIGMDKLTDIALLKIQSDNIQFADLGDSDNLIHGEWVVALGNPYNLFSVSKEPSATIGIISGKNVNFGLKESGHVYQNMIQTDASINPGNSGGPLINVSGKVIGINTFIITESKGTGGIGFSIPINRVKDIVSDLIQFGKVGRNWITGITVRELNSRYKKYLKLDVDSGVIVSDVEKKSAAESAGILLRDIIYKVNGKSVNSAKEIEEILDEGYFKTGDEVDIIIIRNNSPIKVLLKLIDPHGE